MLKRTVHAFAAALLCLGALSPLAARAEVIDVDSAELARLAASGVVVVDIRTEPEWKETGVIAGSHLLTFFDEKGRADPAAWLEKLKAFAPPDRQVAVICRSGNRTQPVSRLLAQQAGYRTVYNVRKGIRAWSADGRPLVPAAAEATAAASCAPGARC